MDKNKKILVVGNFDVLHPGHVRLLKFAKECGNYLIVAVNSNLLMKNRQRVDQQHRLEMVQALGCVDEAFLTDDEVTVVIAALKPWGVVKGKEFEGLTNPESELLRSYGGRLIFGSGDYLSSTETVFHENSLLLSQLNFSLANDYVQRHDVSAISVANALDRFKKIRALVIGELIVDEYVQGKAVGMSQEDPTIVITPTESFRFLGGAAITAGHLKSIGAHKVTFISVIGNDESANFAKSKCGDYELDAFLITDDSRPTSMKTRYRVENKTLLRVNQVRNNKISVEIQNLIYERVCELANELDLLVFSDFNYGVLPQELVDRILELCRTKNLTIVADSQSSSQVGDISRFKGMKLITPTENEARIALNNMDDGLVTLAIKLQQVSKAENIVITLGSEGIFIHKPGDTSDAWENDRIPALNTNAVDPAGAGDCFLAASALMMVVGATPWEAHYLGSIAAACQVGRVGNTPLQRKILQEAVHEALTIGRV